jgi:hypothetical protein
MRARLALVAIALTGCVATTPDLTAQPYPCDTDHDCIDGWVCAITGVLSHSVCRPACDPSHPSSCANGFCTSAGVCWDACSIASDGTLTRGCTGGMSCVRRNGFTGEGLCMPAAGCTVSSDCTATSHDCANEIFHLPSTVPGTAFSADHSVCLSTPEGEMHDRCPTGYFANNGTCIPSCDQPTDRCPPGMACLRDLGAVLGAPGRSPCLMGWRGMPCRDDSECYEGRCLAIATGAHVCTFTCEQAAMAGPLGCDVLDGYTIAGFGGLDFSCDPSGVCAAVGAVGAPCNDQLPCDAELACLNGAGVCTKPCSARTDCVIDSVGNATLRSSVYCAPITSPSGSTLHFCLNQQPVGAMCTTNEECQSGRCMSERCVVPLPR